MTRKPGRAAAGQGQLVDLRVKASAGLHVSALRALGRDDLDQRHLRHRIEEVQADEPAGVGELCRELLEHDARGVGGEQRVGFSRGSSRANSSRLASAFSKIASMTTSALGDAVALDVGRQRAIVSSRFAGSRARFSKNSRARSSAGCDVLEVAILQRDREAAQRAPGGDVAAHDAGADHVHACADFADVLAAQALEPFLQEEHAHEVARGRRADELARSSALRPRSAVRRIAPCRRHRSTIA